MKQTLKSISCDPMCGFMVQSHDEKEVLDLAMTHAKKVHPEMNMTMNQIKGYLKTVRR